MFEVSTWAVNHDADMLTKSLFAGKHRVRSKAKKFNKSNSSANESSPQMEKLQHIHENVNNVAKISRKATRQLLNLSHLDDGGSKKKDPLNGESVSRKRKKTLKNRKEKSTIQGKLLNLSHLDDGGSKKKDPLNGESVSRKRKKTLKNRKEKSTIQGKRLHVDDEDVLPDNGYSDSINSTSNSKSIASLNPDNSEPYRDSVKHRKSNIDNASRGSSVNRKGNKDIMLKHKLNRIKSLHDTNNAKAVLHKASVNVVRESSVMTSSKAQISVKDSQTPGGFAAGKKRNMTKGLDRHRPVFNVSKLQEILYVHEESTSARSKNLSAGSHKSKSAKKQAPLNLDNVNNHADALPISIDIIRQSTPSSSSSSSSLKSQMLNRLNSARFRYLNEQLYTCTGKEAFMMFEDDREAFHVYHTGYQGQVAKWPINPLNLIIRYIKSRPQTLIIADFGCGDAQLALSVPNKVHSFDLVALNDRVTACNMSKVPLRDCSVDLGVFCLSLMGTTLTEYLKEANRVIKIGGVLKIAEVISRFQKLSQFIHKMSKLGFTLIDKDDSNQMFVMMAFKKDGKPNVNVPQLTLDPCIYKRR